MARKRPQYLVDENGSKTGVLLGIKEYEDMVRRIEELEDAVDLDEAMRTGEVFRDYQEVRQELQSEGLL